MDGVGAAASIIGIATAGAQISIKLITLAQQVRTASSRVNAIANDVALTSAVLQQIGDFVNPKPDDGFSVLNKPGLQTTANSARTCERIFEDLHHKIKKASSQLYNVRDDLSGKKIILSRLEQAKWPFLQPSMDSLRADLREAKGTLTLILQVASLAYAKRIASFNSNSKSAADNQEDLYRVIRTFTAQGFTLQQPPRPEIPTSTQEEHVSDRSGDIGSMQDLGASKINNIQILSQPAKDESSQPIDKMLQKTADMDESAKDVSNKESDPGTSRNTQPTGSREIPSEMPTQNSKQVQDSNLEDELPKLEPYNLSSVRPSKNDLMSPDVSSVLEGAVQSPRPKSKSSSIRYVEPLSLDNLGISEECINTNTSHQHPQIIKHDLNQRTFLGGKWIFRYPNLLRRLSWNSPRLLSKRQPISINSGAETNSLQLHFQKPSACDFQDGILLTWSTHSCQAAPQEDIQAFIRKILKRRLLVTEELDNLSPEQSQRVFKFLNNLPHGAELVHMHKTIGNIEYKGITIRNVPSYCFVVSVPLGSQPTRRPHNVGCLAPARPTFIKVSKEYMAPLTLDLYGIPWEWDVNDENFIIIKQWIPECDQVILFEHSWKLFEQYPELKLRPAASDAAVGYDKRNYKLVEEPGDRRSRSRTRRHSASSIHKKRSTRTRISGLVERARSKSGARQSRSRLRTGLPMVAAGLGSAVTAGLNKKNEAQKKKLEALTSPERTRSIGRRIRNSRDQLLLVRRKEPRRKHNPWVDSGSSDRHRSRSRSSSVSRTRIYTNMERDISGILDKSSESLSEDYFLGQNRPEAYRQHRRRSPSPVPSNDLVDQLLANFTTAFEAQGEEGRGEKEEEG